MKEPGEIGYWNKTCPLQFHCQRTIFMNSIKLCGLFWKTIKTEKVVGKLLFLMAVCATSFFTFVCRYLMSFSFLTTWHIEVVINVSSRKNSLDYCRMERGYYYFTFTLVLTPSTKTFAGLKAGML